MFAHPPEPTADNLASILAQVRQSGADIGFCQDPDADRLAVIARVFGLQPAPPSQCRVLELGCASGGNLISMAGILPRSTFVGVDLSVRQIADAQAMAARVGLANVEFMQMDLAQVDASAGMFDYVIAHGVYSWIPREAQDRLLAICHDNLAQGGVAYVSYNTHPGWRMRGMIRDMLVYHTRRFPDPAVKIAQGRALLDFMTGHVPTQDSPYGAFLKVEVEALRKVTDTYLLHEHLEDVNEPIYFHEFAERAQARGLRYLGDADFGSMLSSNLPSEVADTLRKIAPDLVEMEQYMDFLRNRPFRQSLLVHQGAPIKRDLDWHSLAGLHVASQMKPGSAAPDLRSTAIEQFKIPGGAGLGTPDPVVKAAMMVLSERWPQDIAIDDLHAAGRARLSDGPRAAPDPDAVQDEERVTTELLRCYAAGLVELRVEALPMTLSISERPRASRLAREQARDTVRVTNLRHEPVPLDELTRQVIQCLDGEHDKAAIVEIAAKLAGQGVLEFRQGDQPIKDPATIRQILEVAVPQCLDRLAKLALLEA